MRAPIAARFSDPLDGDGAFSIRRGDRGARVRDETSRKRAFGRARVLRAMVVVVVAVVLSFASFRFLFIFLKEKGIFFLRHFEEGCLIICARVLK